MRLSDIIVESNSIEKNPTFISDKKSVSEWINVPVGEIKIEMVAEPISKFKTQIIEMYNTYDEFPQDAKRTNKIVNLLKQGAPALPVWVEKDDPHLFVMEGRHRMVAFYLLGLTEILVAYVSQEIL